MCVHALNALLGDGKWPTKWRLALQPQVAPNPGFREFVCITALPGNTDMPK